MQSYIQAKAQTKCQSISMVSKEEKYLLNIRRYTSEAWCKIAPFWPLKNLIAVNPLQGFEDLSFEQAIMAAKSYFQRDVIPTEMDDINRETIKWCQAFFDEGQAIINMPFRDEGLYRAWRKLIVFDKRLYLNAEHRNLLENLPPTADQAIAMCLIKLNISLEECSLFLTLLLTTLPGWAGYIKYRTEWVQENNVYLNPVTQADYLAMRLVITCIIWPEAIDLLALHKNNHAICAIDQMKKITSLEKKYKTNLLNVLSLKNLTIKSSDELPDAQFVFCIDVRSESFRRAIEMQGNYETFGIAGFFGVSARIKNELTGEIYSSCPVLVHPRHTVKEKIICSKRAAEKILRGKIKIHTMKRVYNALKYTFTTPFVIVEVLGPFSGLWMSLRTILPIFSNHVKQTLVNLIRPCSPVSPDITKSEDKDGINFNDQCAYAESALCVMGLTKNFSEIVVLCGHGSSTQNNAYASALDCGACRGYKGDASARILAMILNDTNVRKYLATKNILIPSKTKFIPALHDTTIDDVTLYLNENHDSSEVLRKLILDLKQAQKINSGWRYQRSGHFNEIKINKNYMKQVKKRSADWAETRPEWGLARNASFIIGPRFLTKQVDLDGRAFLHSYDWQQDKDGVQLTAILTAPMIVAQWINSQYLFSTIDNVAYGSGSKITHNITGKFGVMQGNGSDLMTGLPSQSIFLSDTNAYHEPVRLIVLVYASRFLVSDIISHHSILQKLFGNGWVSLVCIDPIEGGFYSLQRNLTWSMTQQSNANFTPPFVEHRLNE